MFGFSCNFPAFPLGSRVSFLPVRGGAGGLALRVARHEREHPALPAPRVSPLSCSAGPLYSSLPCLRVRRPPPPFQFTHAHLPPGGRHARSPPDLQPPARGPALLDSVVALGASVGVRGDAVGRRAAPGGRPRRGRRSKGEPGPGFLCSTVCPPFPPALSGRMVSCTAAHAIWGMR